jgi:hypothetical protein
MRQRDAERSCRPTPGLRPYRPGTLGVVNMSSRQIVGSRPVSLATMVPGGSARRHSRRCRLLRFSCSSSTFLRSLRSMAVTPLRRYYGRSDSCPPDSGTLHRSACSTCGQVSLIHAFGLPAIPSPTTSKYSASSGHVTHGRVEPRWHPTNGSSPKGNSGLRPSLAGSPLLAGRIEFVILRTDRSPPVASHHASRRDLALQRDRSYVRLQVTLTWRGLSPPSPICALRRTSAGLQPGIQGKSTTPAGLKAGSTSAAALLRRTVPANSVNAMPGGATQALHQNRSAEWARAYSKRWRRRS